MLIRLLLITFFSLNAYALKPVQFVSIEKFSGLWYEIARTPNSYQENCVASSVEYVLKNNEYKIYNRCFENEIGGKLISYNGVGQSASKNKNSVAKIDMTYFWIFTKRYNIAYIDKDYKSALVTDEDNEHIWIMSRTPKMKKKKLDLILDKLKDHIDLNTLIYTKQDKQGRYK
ncbi:hypothetical protein CPU12_04745 [Malaciobacter molluscorum LMG 25693]|uniref:Lipocalin domain-containing protein n=1 Tax=Malaciobacter molluscorum LMG 25693 TaxID=870501 RepID=A0A2G1DJE1_9BACT|nr:lipocalin family protein [Malaciobacter molluscorum]AXX91614.1 lipocalin domain-containing protein [Malaciobacter molluscorum LMG 25693]PHO18591.1 hypothetical protein CPU12_04745 [Malaciobacter molluscorum LMG 25693]RXJ94578.1 hypothetical protein CRV00_06530 [Malaciobacter molluscorum]